MHRMELDTGASVSLISEATLNKLWPGRTALPSSVNLKTYTGEKVSVLGSIRVLASNGSTNSILPLLVTKTDGPSLIGRNWLAPLNLNVEQIHQLQVNKPLEELLSRHKKCFGDELGCLKGFKAKLFINPDVAPKFNKARPLPYSTLPLVDAALDDLVDQRVIEPITHADWAAPIVPVLKRDKKTVRICGDFSVTINSATKLDAYPIPRIEDLFTKLTGGKSFTKLDMSQAYLQIEIEEDSKDLLTINTHRGLFRYNRLPFGVSSAPGIFQRAMESLLYDIPSVVVYLDDILVTGKTDEEHLVNLEKVLQRMETHGLRLNKNKCTFMAPEVVYLGHKIDENGLHPTEDKVRTVRDAPQPTNVSELRTYLGLLSNYSKFLPNLSTTLAPPYSLLKSYSTWSWSDSQNEAFLLSKRMLLSSQVLAHYDPEQQLILACDASPVGLGAVLSHRYADGTERPIGYTSRSLSQAERNYSQIEREGLACVFGVKRFHRYLYGRQFELITDHEPLLTLFSEKKHVSLRNLTQELERSC